MAAPKLSAAGSGYARAVCLPSKMEQALFEDLSPTQQSCLEQVGTAFQHDIEESLGFGGGTSGATGDIRTLARSGPEHLILNDASGEKVGDVYLEPDGDIDVCTRGRACLQVVEHGSEVQLAALKKTLTQAGFTLSPQGG